MKKTIIEKLYQKYVRIEELDFLLERNHIYYKNKKIKEK